MAHAALRACAEHWKLQLGEERLSPAGRKAFGVGGDSVPCDFMP